jgi:phage major head subunit gpT-like protein
MDVTAFTAMARSEFMQGKLAADEKPYPASHDLFTSVFPSKVKVETHTYMSNLPRLAEFKGYTPFTKLTNKEYTVANREYRVGLSVRKTDIDDDQIGGYLKSVQGLPARARKDVGHKVLAHLAAGTSNLCFDDTAFFANSHAVGSGDNLDTFDGSGNDGATHKIIALVTDNSVIKPVIFQDREPLSELQTTAETPQARLLKEYDYWVDGRFGMGYGFWWDAVHMTITDTPDVGECYEIVEQLVNQFRTFTLPKGKDTDDALYIHEGWDPTPSNFVLCCNLKLGVVLRRALALSQYVTATGNVDNVYKDIATVLPTSALGA